MDIILASVVNFALVLLVLWYFGRKPTAEAFATRRTTIQSAIAEAETQYLQAEKSLNTWESKWKSSEAQAKQLFEEAKTAMARFRDRTIDGANHESERIRREAQLVTKGEVLKARRMLQQEMAERSIAMAETVLTKNLDERDKHKLVSDYVEMVGNGKA